MSSKNIYVHDVSGCEICPFFDDGRTYGKHDRLICNHPKAPRQTPTPLEPITKVKPIETWESGCDLSWVEIVITPDWCPLKVENILIKYSEK